ncbi:pentapeptide repeat-containing protein [Aquimarina sp. AU474]|uniref:pentapeptide repeat-containing protein n=1 Tax=Aquimarina sp. AU474 TaxID=2108529 RepID=UPI001358BDC0|nr:pentapeptide repeat-containing protein [Aquimarina sp. AU474]
MTETIIDQSFENMNFSGQKMPAKEYDNCVFKHCDFSNVDMSVITFLECRFENCDFTSVMLKNTTVQNVVCVECKMQGVNFSICNDFMFSIQFKNCNLNYASFYGFVIKNTLFDSCLLKETDFTDADLTGSNFSNSELSGAIFNNTIAEKVDFTLANNFDIDPSQNKLKNAKFSKNNLIGLLRKFNINIS